MCCKTSKDRKLSLQSLEQRQMMAGDVGVQLADGVLSIDGDSNSNAVQVSQLGDGSYSVRGLYSGGATTKINGSYSTRTFSGVTDIDINMGNNRDIVYLNGDGNFQNNLKGDLNVQMGYHKDDLHLNNFWVEGDIDLATDPLDNSWNASSQGDDLLKITNSVAYGELDIRTSEGHDKVEIKSTNGFWNAFHDGITIDTGEGTKDGDDVILDRVFTWKGLDIDTSNGGDTVDGRSLAAYNGDIEIDTYHGADDVTIRDTEMVWNHTSHPCSVKINTGSGNDDVVLQNVKVQGEVRVTTGNGHDDVYMHNVEAQDQFYMSLGSGNDDLTIKSSKAGLAYLYGGSNYSAGDMFVSHDNDIDLVIKSGWEVLKS